MRGKPERDTRSSEIFFSDSKYHTTARGMLARFHLCRPLSHWLVVHGSDRRRVVQHTQKRQLFVSKGLQELEEDDDYARDVNLHNHHQHREKHRRGAPAQR